MLMNSVSLRSSSRMRPLETKLAEGPRTKYGCDSKLSAVCEGKGRPLLTLLRESRVSEFKNTALLLDERPVTQVLLCDEGLGVNRFGTAQADRKIVTCIR